MATPHSHDNEFDEGSLTAAQANALTLARLAAQTGHEIGALDILVLPIGDVVGIADFFVIMSASNSRLVRAVVDKIEEKIAEELNERPQSVEGADSRSWVLLDYVSTVIHVFSTGEREYYRLERLYGDVQPLDWTV